MMAMKQRNGLLALILAAAVAAPALAQQDPAAPGIPPSRNGWEYDVEVANRLLNSGYLQAAEQDYTKILTAYPDHVMGIDLAWLGLAKVHMARGDVERSRSALGEVLRRDNDPGISHEARQRYRSLQAEAEILVNEARRAVYYYEDRLRRTSWLNIFGKFFNWLDVRKAKKDLNKAAAAANAFDPRFLIEPVMKPAAASVDPETAGSDTFTLTTEQMAAILNQTATGGQPAASTDPVATTGAGTETGASTEDPAPASGTVVPAAAPAASGDIETLKKSYLSTYQDLRQALGSGDQARIQAATDAYKTAKEAYEGARTANYQAGS